MFNDIIIESMRKAIIILYAILFFVIFSSFWGFYISIRPQKIISSTTPDKLGLRHEAVSFATKDGLELKGWFLPSQAGAGSKTIILLHGYPADKGDILTAMSFLNKNYNLLFFDFRYLGQSEGNYSTAGAKEKEDLLAAILFLKSRGISKVGVWGFSVGGAVALMTAPQTPEIKTVISESSYARLDLLALRLYPIPLLKYPIGYLVRLWGIIILGIDIKNVAPAESAKALEIPTLIIHSTNDEVIPFEHGLLLKEALSNNSRAEFWFAENLVHGQFNPDYQKRVEAFLQKSL